MLRTVIFSIALIIAAAVLGYQVKQVGGGREIHFGEGPGRKAHQGRPRGVDRAACRCKGATIADALGKLRREKPALDQFLVDGGFRQGGADRVERVGRAQLRRSRRPQRQHAFGAGRARGAPVGHHQHRPTSRASSPPSKAIVQFQADGHPVSYGQPQFLVSNLEEVKMSLIGAAMQNSRVRPASSPRMAT